MLKHHLNKGIKKGALTEEEAEKRFLKWLDEKEKKEFMVKLQLMKLKKIQNWCLSSKIEGYY